MRGQVILYVSALHILLHINHANAVIPVYLDEKQTYHAWTYPSGHGRCGSQQTLGENTWHFFNIKGQQINKLLDDPCSYEITCPHIRNYDSHKILCTIEPDWNKSLSSCVLATAIIHAPSGNYSQREYNYALLDADKQYKCFINKDTKNSRYFYPREEMTENSVCGSTVYAVTEKDAQEAIMVDTPEKQSNVLCHTYPFGKPKPQCSRTKTTTIQTCTPPKDNQAA